MNRWLIAFILIALMGATVIGAWQWQQQNLIEPLSFGSEVLTPGPLKGPLGQSNITLSTAGVLAETNRHRSIDDLPALHANTTLDLAAQKKVDDMFKNQYFAHEAPNGTGPADLAESVHYEYIRVGENLALGNFTSDAALVQAWMDSPGHRANILHKGFSEVGLAVGRGMFEGTHVWLAVQEFGAPLSSCPAIDPTLQKQFEALKTHLDQLNTTLTAQKNELEDLQSQLDTRAGDIKPLAEAGQQKTQDGNEQIDQGNKIYQETNDRSQAQPYWDRGQQLQEEGQALLETAKQKQNEYDSLFDAYEQKLSAFNAGADTQKKKNDEIQSVQSKLNQQIRAFNECIK